MVGTVSVARKPQEMRFEAFREAVSHTFVPLLAETGDENSFTGAVTYPN